MSGNELLYTQLQKDGYIVIFKPTLAIKRGKKIVVKGNVDAELVLHSMIEYPNYDKAIIISGDGDFHCLVKYLAQKSRLLKLMAPSRSGVSSLLREFGEYVIFVEDLKASLAKNVGGINLRTNP